MSNDDGMDEQVVSTSKNLLYTFPSPGNYGVRLIASNGNCTDSTGDI
jgi:PKD repeat protein